MDLQRYTLTMVREEARCKINAFFEKIVLKKCFHLPLACGKACADGARAGEACARAFHFRYTLPSQSGELLPLLSKLLPVTGELSPAPYQL